MQELFWQMQLHENWLATRVRNRSRITVKCWDFQVSLPHTVYSAELPPL